MGRCPISIAITGGTKGNNMFGYPHNRDEVPTTSKNIIKVVAINPYNNISDILDLSKNLHQNIINITVPIKRTHQGNVNTFSLNQYLIFVSFNLVRNSNTSFHVGLLLKTKHAPLIYNVFFGSNLLIPSSTISKRFCFTFLNYLGSTNHLEAPQILYCLIVHNVLPTYLYDHLLL